MPITKIDIDKKNGGLAIWKIDESEADLAFHAQEQCPEEIISSQKRLEWLAGRNVITALTEKMDLNYNGLHKNEFGKPFLKGLSIEVSLTHSYPYVAAQLSLHKPVGIDLEQPKEKLLAIAARVLSPEELKDAGTDIVKHCVYWCSKEALYKIDGKKGLHFSNQLNIQPFTLQKNGSLQGTITRHVKQLIDLMYLVEPEFVLVYRRL
jgi:4'-phosphopantetheinyl transferase